MATNMDKNCKCDQNVKTDSYSHLSLSSYLCNLKYKTESFEAHTATKDKNRNLHALKFR